MAEISKIQLPDGTSYDIQDKTSGYITGYTETDPIFSTSPAAGITAADIANWNSGSSLPSQTGNAGKFLITDGTDASWATINLDDLEDVFVAEHGVTSYSDINEASETGNTLILLRSGTQLYVLREEDPDGGFIFQNGQHIIEVDDNDNWSGSDINIYTTNATNSTSKLFLVGATSQATAPQTYSNSNVYATSGVLNATSYSINAAANIIYNSTTKSIDFTFN